MVKDGTIKKLEELALNSVPTGTVVAWAGKKPPNDNWRICNGDSLKTKDFTALYKTLDDGNIYGKSGDEFNLPNYQGYFLRGVSKTKEQDPDRDTRKGGPVVGSTQKDAFESHQHIINVLNGTGGDTDTVKYAPAPKKAVEEHNGKDGKNGILTAFINPPAKHSSETRPRNVYVHWIIKVK